MKTKALLLAAALMAVGAGTSMAQVYSANAVGYVNLSLPAGFSIIANPLNNTNNGLNTILSSAPSQTRVYRFDPVSNGYQIATKLPPGWNTNLVFNPGEGFFISLPSALNVTFVGEVPQGSLSNPIVGGNHFQLRSSQVPQALPLGKTGAAAGTTLEYPAGNQDVVYLFTPGTGPYTFYTFLGGPQVWSPVNAGSNGGLGPTINVGTGFFLKRAGADVNWTRNFSVN